MTDKLIKALENAEGGSRELDAKAKTFSRFFWLFISLALASLPLDFEGSFTGSMFTISIVFWVGEAILRSLKAREASGGERL